MTHSVIPTMQALIVESYNNPFEKKEIKRPVPGIGQVLVQIKASTVNPLDLKIKSGRADHARTKLPAILGIDLAGVVVAVGSGVSSFKPGDEVYGMTGGVGGIQGSLAQYAAVDASLLARRPANLSMREAAALPLIFITAWEGLVDRAHIAANQKVLIHGGAGGVGHVAVQIARAFGAHVFATDSGRRIRQIESYGATAIDYNKKTVEQYVEEYTQGEGFDIVYDTVGGATLDASFQAAKRYTGHVVSCLGWGTHALAPLSFRAATYSGVFTLLPLLSGHGRAHHAAILNEATKLVELGKVIPSIDPQHFTMESIDDAYRLVESRQASGKVIIEIA